MPNTRECLKFNSEVIEQALEEAGAARERMAEILDTDYKRDTPEGERAYFRAIRELRELMTDFPNLYARLFFLRSIRYLRKTMFIRR